MHLDRWQVCRPESWTKQKGGDKLCKITLEALTKIIPSLSSLNDKSILYLKANQWGNKLLHLLHMCSSSVFVFYLLPALDSKHLLSICAGDWLCTVSDGQCQSLQQCIMVDDPCPPPRLKALLTVPALRLVRGCPVNHFGSCAEKNKNSCYKLQMKLIIH